MDRNDIRKVLAKDAKLYIFDMDGTILNSMVEWFHLGRNYLVAQGVAVPDDLEQRIETMTMDESAEYFQSLGVDKSVPEINEGIFAYIREKYRTSIPAKEGMLDLIRKLSQKEDSILCILTTSERKCAEMAMERLDILNCFRDIFDSEQIGLNKRSGAIYQWVCEHYDVAQKDTIIFEDAIYAVKAAKETDCYVYGMKDSSNSTVWNEICEMADDIIC